MSKASSIIFVCNKQEKSISYNATSTLQVVKLEVAKQFKIDLKLYELFLKESKIEKDSLLLKDIIGGASGSKIELREKSKKEEIPVIKESKDNKSNTKKEKEQSILQINTSFETENKPMQRGRLEINKVKLKLTEFHNLNDIIEIVDSLLAQIKINKENLKKGVSLSQITLEFECVDDGHKMYKGLQAAKSNDKRFNSLKVVLFLGKSFVKDYHYPSQPKNYLKGLKEVDAQTNSTKSGDEKVNFHTNSSLSKSFKQIPSSINTKMKLSAGSTSMTKQNVIKHLNYYEEAKHDPVKMRELIINKQQKLLNQIHPSLVRISTPYISEEEKRLYEENKSKEKWVDKRGFKQATSLYAARKLPVIPNYVNASPSLPPILHNFREIKKDHWVRKSGFLVC